LIRGTIAAPLADVLSDSAPAVSVPQFSPPADFPHAAFAERLQAVPKMAEEFIARCEEGLSTLRSIKRLSLHGKEGMKAQSKAKDLDALQEYLRGCVIGQLIRRQIAGGSLKVARLKKETRGLKDKHRRWDIHKKAVKMTFQQFAEGAKFVKEQFETAYQDYLKRRER
jgi:hypothetical protein